MLDVNVKRDNAELISLYIPPRRPLTEVIAQLRVETGTALQITKQPHRDNVVRALNTIINCLKNFHNTPELGIAIFHGADLPVYYIEPANKPININMYRCDDHFYLEPLNQ